MQGRNQDLRLSSTLKGQVIVSMAAHSDIALIPSDCCHDMVRLQYSDSEDYSNKMIASAAVLVLLLIALLAILMHMYAKRCLLHFGAQRQALWRRWQGIDLAPQEPFRAIGLGGTIIDTLPVFVYKGQKAGEEALECMVCLCEFKENDKGRMLPKCNHSFHIHCIDTWFRLHSTCPLCRTPAGPERAAVAPFDNNPEEVSTQSEASEASEHVEVSEVYARGGLEPPLSLSQLSQENIGIQYPTNILFWGDYTHVNSRISSPEVDCDPPPGDQYVTHTVLDIPRREGVFSNRSILRTSSGCPLTDEQASSPIGQLKEFPMAHLKTFKWLLRRERRVSPSDQDEREPEQGAGVSNG